MADYRGFSKFVLIIGLFVYFVPVVAGDACAGKTGNTGITFDVCAQRSLVMTSIYLDFSNAKDNLPCSCKIYPTFTDALPVVIYTTPASSICATEIQISNSGSPGSNIITCQSSVTDTLQVTQSSSVSIKIQKNLDGVSLDTNFCLNVFSATGKNFNMTCGGSSNTDTTTRSPTVTTVTADSTTTIPGTTTTVGADNTASSQVTIIVGAVIGGLLVVIIVCIVLFICYRRRWSKLKGLSADNESERNEYVYDNNIDMNGVHPVEPVPGNSQCKEAGQMTVTESKYRPTKQEAESSQKPHHVTKPIGSGQYLDMSGVQTKPGGDDMNETPTGNDFQYADVSGLQSTSLGQDKGQRSMPLYAIPDNRTSDKGKHKSQCADTQVLPVYAKVIKNKARESKDQTDSSMNVKNSDKHQMPTKSLVNADGLQYADLDLGNENEYSRKETSKITKGSDVQYADLQIF